MKNYFIPIILLLILISSKALAISLEQTITESVISGKIRVYDFDRAFDKATIPNQHSLAVGGELSVLSGPVLLPGLQLGGSYYTSQPIAKSDNPLHIDLTLPGFSLSTLDQAYVQYHRELFLLRAGYQVINTPWINASDSRMIPAAYQGYFSTFGPWHDITLTALRIYRFKGRVEDNFSRTNLYYPSNIGGIPITVSILGQHRSNEGALALAAAYKKNAVDTQAWFYQFYDFAKMVYVDSKYTFSEWRYFKPFIAAQIVRQWGDGKDLLKTNSQALGFLVGANVEMLTMSLGYNTIPRQHGAFKQGDIVSPYTAGYATDPLYTTSMISGLIEKAAGQAFKLTTTLNFFDKKLQFAASHARYYTARYFTVQKSIDTNETDFDVTYNFAGKLKGFSIRDRIGILYGNPAVGRFVYNRVMLQYVF
ncbi:hypothetical protein BH10PSE19_BH10PSE19_07670 [soil metagenome]